MQPCKTGDQLYSDDSPYSECSLAWHSSKNVVRMLKIGPIDSQSKPMWDPGR